PEGLLKPHEVYRAGILFLVLGLIIGTSFVFIRGYIIALILCFATLSIILYSNKLVNLGLGELFVGIKGMFIVIGSFYIQTITITLQSIIAGIIIGFLSAIVLYINSIPDIKADKEKGRKTLAIILENHSKLKIFLFVLGLFISIYLLTAIVFYYFVMDNIYLVIPCLFLIPLAIIILHKFCIYLYNNPKSELFYEEIMEKTVLFSRLYGLTLITGILIMCIQNYK
ncbi:MAG: prenyltransferase, partial [Nitrosopumilus sp.]|nr:prenyltransferase [Nitrosopumilus sp.]